MVGIAVAAGGLVMLAIARNGSARITHATAWGTLGLGAAFLLASLFV